MEDDGALPTEVWFRILSFMTPTGLIPLRTVCHNWKAYVDSDYPWVGYVEKFYGRRYEKAGFLADPTLTWQSRFWRMTRLHSNWEKGDYSSEVLGGSFGHVRQMRLDGDKLAMNHGDKLHVFDMTRNQRIWKFSEDMSFGNTIPSFDLKAGTLVVPSMHGTARRKLAQYRSISRFLLLISRDTNLNSCFSLLMNAISRPNCTQHLQPGARSTTQLLAHRPHYFCRKTLFCVHYHGHWRS